MLARVSWALSTESAGGAKGLQQGALHPYAAPVTSFFLQDRSRLVCGNQWRLSSRQVLYPDTPFKLQSNCIEFLWNPVGGCSGTIHGGRATPSLMRSFSALGEGSLVLIHSSFGYLPSSLKAVAAPYICYSYILRSKDSTSFLCNGLDSK